MQVNNVGNNTIEVTATYEEISAITVALSNYAIQKDNDYLQKLAYELANAKVKTK